MTTDDLRVRQAADTDAEAIQRVARASWHAAYDTLLGPDTVTERIDSWFDPERLRRDDIEPSDRPLLVAEMDGRVVGFTEAVVDDPDGEPSSATVAQLYRIYVLPEYWGEGVGTRLLDRIESVLRDRGQDRLELSVLAENEAAIGFYESRGFTSVDSTAGDTHDSERIEYAKDL